MAGYASLFKPGTENGTLEQTERRYAWIKRKLREYELQR